MRKPKSKLINNPIVIDDQIHVCVGFDVSSETVGYSIFYIQNNKIIKLEYEYYKPEDKKIDELNSIYKLYGFICKLLLSIKRDAELYCNDNNLKDPIIHVYVENYLLFMKGHSTAKTITTLSVYNRTVCLAIFNALAIVPMLLPVITIRSVLKKMSDSVDRIDKEHVPDAIELIINKFWENKNKWFFEWEYKRNNKPKVECFDMADGIAAGLAGMFKTNLLKVEQ